MLKTKTICLICNQVCDPTIHKCTKDSDWCKYYGRFEEIFNVRSYKKAFLKKVNIVKNKFQNKKKVTIWDFSELLPVKKNFTLGEGGTPLYQLKKYKHEYTCNIYVKNEGINPSNVYKDRESAIVINQCIDKKIGKISLASTGNAAQSISLYANRANIETFLFISDKASKEKIAKMICNKSKLIILKDSLMEDAFKANRDLSNFLETQGIKDCNPGINWLRREGSKTIAYELFIQLGRVPEWIIVPCGNGSSIRSIFKGFKELKEMGVINNLPKMVGVQIKGGDPIPQGYNKQQLNQPLEINNPPLSLGDSAAASFDYFAAVKAIQESGGYGIGVTDKNIARCLSEYIHTEQTLLKSCLPEVITAEVFPALDLLIMKKLIKKNQTVVLFFSSHAINDRDNVKELLEKYKYRGSWKLIEKYLPSLYKNVDYCLNNSKGSVRFVSNNLTNIKQAVLDLMKY